MHFGGVFQPSCLDHDCCTVQPWSWIMTAGSALVHGMFLLHVSSPCPMCNPGAIGGSNGAWWLGGRRCGAEAGAGAVLYGAS